MDAGNDLWRGWTLAGALGISVVITGRTRRRENGRRKKKGAAAHSKKCPIIFRDTDVQKAKKCNSKLRNPL